MSELELELEAPFFTTPALAKKGGTGSTTLSAAQIKSKDADPGRMRKFYIGIDNSRSVKNLFRT